MTAKSALTIPFLLAQSVQAAVTVVWTEDATGVTASYSGFINTSVFVNEQSRLETQGEEAIRNNQAFAYYDGGELRRYLSVRTSALPIVLDARDAPFSGSGVGDPFSFAANDLFVDSEYLSGSPIAGSAFFSGETLGTMFDNRLDDLAGRTSVVWIAKNGEEMVFYHVVPEPSVLIFSFVGLCGLLTRRREI